MSELSSRRPASRPSASNESHVVGSPEATGSGSRSRCLCRGFLASAIGLRGDPGTSNLGASFPAAPATATMPTEVPTPEPRRPSFRTTLVRVLIVQAVALAALALVQLGYHG